MRTAIAVVVGLAVGTTLAWALWMMDSSVGGRIFAVVISLMVGGFFAGMVAIAGDGEREGGDGGSPGGC